MSAVIAAVLSAVMSTAMLTLIAAVISAVRVMSAMMSGLMSALISAVVLKVMSAHVRRDVMFKPFQISSIMLVKIFHLPRTQSIVKVGPVWDLQCTDGETCR